MENKTHNSKIVWMIIVSFLLVPLIVSVVSTIHVINFFELSNNYTLAVTLAIAFEIGALSALAGLVAMGKINKNVVWFIFILLTIFQMTGNVYYAYDIITNRMKENPDLIKNWAELFGLADDEAVTVKRIIAILSGAVLPIVSLSFLDLLIDYIRKTFGIDENKRAESTDEKAAVDEPAFEEEKKTDVTEEDAESVESKLDEIAKDNIVDEGEQEDFEKLLNDKKKRLDNMREPYFEMLDVLYGNGIVNVGDELPNYNDFIASLDMNRFSQKEINLFLTICNYLEIFRVSNTHKIALKGYVDAKETLSNYLSLGD
jgi:hypothetical protein